MGLALCRQSHMHMSKVVLVDLDRAVKSTLLHCLEKGELAHATPTVGFNVGSLEPDSGPGQGGMQALRKDHMEGCDALVFMVDGVDRGRRWGREGAGESPLMVLVNKTDLAEAMGLQEVTDGLWLEQSWDIDWEVQRPWALWP
ncbi:ADP-ribosylation factor-like protein 3 [Coregonus clupeaformis]|uniref:ADP-ribosylation factor-like protein 3 n=1 Tax=Coregonus clupeaformis TaxID=59861 RepID=UPI001BE0195F|nr:ADP-ribosylation factor-like protein 3 [Coregonus clupeaformis]